MRQRGMTICIRVMNERQRSALSTNHFGLYDARVVNALTAKGHRVMNRTAVGWTIGGTLASVLIAFVGLVLSISFRADDQRAEPIRHAQLAEAIAVAADRHQAMAAPVYSASPELSVPAPVGHEVVPAPSREVIPPTATKPRPVTNRPQAEPTDVRRFTENPSPPVDDPVRSSDRVNMLAFTETPTS